MQAKRIQWGREVAAICYLLFLAGGIMLYFGQGSIAGFLSTYEKIFTFKEAFNETLDFCRGFLTEGIQGKTISQENYGSAIVRLFSMSLLLLVPAFILSAVLGVAKGMFDFRNKNSAANPIGHGTTSVVTSLPDFFFIMCLQWFILLNFPAIKGYVFGYKGWFSLILPIFLVTLYPLMYVARITSAALSEEEGQLYIQMARAKGLPKKAVIRRHMLKKCLTGIAQQLPAIMALLLSNLLIVETLSDYKGGAWRFYWGMGTLRKLEYNESGLVIGLALCFTGCMFLSEMIRIYIQRKYDPERASLFQTLIKLFVRYMLVCFCIIFTILYIVGQVTMPR